MLLGLSLLEVLCRSFYLSLPNRTVASQAVGTPGLKSRSSLVSALTP